MEERSKKLLQLIIDNYIKTAVPVGSKLVAQGRDFALSSATIRNEMAKLEAEAYIYQPHTSAGRAPTAKGYQFYVDNFLVEASLPVKKQEFLNQVTDSFNKYEPALIKDLAKAIAEWADNTVFISFASNDFYYTGLSNLFAQPEFAAQDLVYSISKIIDHLDRVLADLANQVDDQVKILIGRHNPFGPDCSSVLTKYKAKGNYGIIGILGPMRMNYQNNFNLVKHAQNLISNF